MAPITFRNSRIVYYGPHECSNCGVLIVKMGTEWGGTAFTNPQGTIYPNTEWHPHVCDPSVASKRIGANAENRVKNDWPRALAYDTGNGKGFVILAEPPAAPDTEFALAISPNQNYFDSVEYAWQGALRRQTDGLPTWHLNLKRDATSYLSDDLSALPQCPN